MVKDFDIRKYTIRLTKYVLKYPYTKRADGAIVAIKKFVEKHTRAERGKVIIGNELNNEIWKNGRKNPPHKVNVFVQNLKDGRVFVNLENAPKMEKVKEEEKKVEEKKEESLEEITEEEKPAKE